MSYADLVKRSPAPRARHTEQWRGALGAAPAAMGMSDDWSGRVDSDGSAAGRRPRGGVSGPREEGRDLGGNDGTVRSFP